MGDLLPQAGRPSPDPRYHSLSFQPPQSRLLLHRAGGPPAFTAGGPPAPRGSAGADPLQGGLGLGLDARPALAGLQFPEGGYAGGRADAFEDSAGFQPRGRVLVV